MKENVCSTCLFFVSGKPNPDRDVEVNNDVCLKHKIEDMLLLWDINKTGCTDHELRDKVIGFCNYKQNDISSSFFNEALKETRVDKRIIEIVEYNEHTPGAYYVEHVVQNILPISKTVYDKIVDILENQ